MEETDRNEKKKEEIFSRTVRAGKRSYFFDVRRTRQTDFYLCVTESKKIFEGDEGKFHFEKHKLFIYKEDFERFSKALGETMEFILLQGGIAKEHDVSETRTESFIDVSFEDLKDETLPNGEEQPI